MCSLLIYRASSLQRAVVNTAAHFNKADGSVWLWCFLCGGCTFSPWQCGLNLHGHSACLPQFSDTHGMRLINKSKSALSVCVALVNCNSGHPHPGCWCMYMWNGHVDVKLKLELLFFSLKYVLLWTNVCCFNAIFNSVSKNADLFHFCTSVVI